MFGSVLGESFFEDGFDLFILKDIYKGFTSRLKSYGIRRLMMFSSFCKSLILRSTMIMDLLSCWLSLVEKEAEIISMYLGAGLVGV